MEILNLLVRVTAFLLIMSGVPSCNQGWIVGNIPLVSQDSVSNTVFIEIADADSNIHWFHGSISYDSNWCYKHQRLEKVKVQ